MRLSLYFVCACARRQRQAAADWARPAPRRPHRTSIRPSIHPSIHPCASARRWATLCCLCHARVPLPACLHAQHAVEEESQPRQLLLIPGPPWLGQAGRAEKVLLPPRADCAQAGARARAMQKQNKQKRRGAKRGAFLVTSRARGWTPRPLPPPGQRQAGRLAVAGTPLGSQPASQPDGQAHHGRGSAVTPTPAPYQR